MLNMASATSFRTGLQQLEWRRTKRDALLNVNPPPTTSSMADVLVEVLAIAQKPRPPVAVKGTWPARCSVLFCDSFFRVHRLASGFGGPALAGFLARLPAHVHNSV